jgi:hypothetical protein
MKIVILAFSENMSRKFKFLYNLTTITGTLYEDVCTIITISRSELLRMKYVSDKFIEEIKKHFVFSNFFSKNMSFMS